MSACEMCAFEDQRLPAAFWDKVIPEPNTGCWLWLAFEHKGYGRYKKGRAHKASYLALKGSIPQGLELDHRCQTTLCVNPDHLEAVTHTENVRRGRAGRLRPKKDVCTKGHPLSAENLAVDGRGWRTCKECNRLASRRWRSRGCLPPV